MTSAPITAAPDLLKALVATGTSAAKLKLADGAKTADEVVARLVESDDKADAQHRTFGGVGTNRPLTSTIEKAKRLMAGTYAAPKPVLLEAKAQAAPTSSGLSLADLEARLTSFRESIIAEVDGLIHAATEPKAEKAPEAKPPHQNVQPLRK